MNFTKHSRYSLGLLVILLTCSQDKTPLQDLYSLSEQDQVIYQVIFDSLLVYENSSIVVAQNVTDTFQLTGNLYENFPDISTRTIDNFISRNERAQPFPFRFSEQVKLYLISQNDFNAILSEGGWELFYSRYPHSNGFNTFSLPGYNEDSTQCLVYSSNMVNYLAGLGMVIYLEKDTGWSIKKIFTVWIS